MTPPASTPARVLVVDDEEGVRAFLVDALTDAGHEVSQAAAADVALTLLARNSYQIVLTDLRMPGIDGMALLGHIRQLYPEVEVIVLTAFGSIQSAVDAMREGAFDYLTKPVVSPAALRAAVSRALERHQLRAAKEIADSDDHTPLSFGSPAMQTVEQVLRKVAPTEATVLLLGESGTGKEVAARAVHRWSQRATGPFVAVNCAALAASLLESELFGHEKGAFTGAHARQRGRLELADGGTFFLDEVGELAIDLQAKLLRVLQERRFERVGGSQTVLANVRWIAATNRDLSHMVKAGGFREDLYHRLSLFPVRLPPLRERREDIAPPAVRLLARIGRSLGRPGLRLSQDACQALTRADWSGNVRELANTLERSAILTDRAELEADDLALMTVSPEGDGTIAVGSKISDVEREAIERALLATDGNRRLAAARLGIGLRTLYDKLKRYDLG
ncbi:MAG: sigma-54-dependent Fis family transcriptional regulator [Deltaproteobacteria bacterium]|nr:sigma-54-dependent Fis family transcriptional regulator [Deltaproteobacteria bacterium]